MHYLHQYLPVVAHLFLLVLLAASLDDGGGQFVGLCAVEDGCGAVFLHDFNVHVVFLFRIVDFQVDGAGVGEDVEHLFGDVLHAAQDFFAQ